MSTCLYVAANGMGPMNKGSIVVVVLQRSDRLEPQYKLSTLLFFPLQLLRSVGSSVIYLCVAWWCNGYGVGLVIKRSQVRFPAVPPSGNNSGQVVHTRVPLSPSSIIWYRPKCREGNVSMWEKWWPTTHITELCLQLTAGSGPCKQRWALTIRSQNCERVMLTMGGIDYRLRR